MRSTPPIPHAPIHCFCAFVARLKNFLALRLVGPLCSTYCSNKPRASGIIGTRRIVQLFVPVSGHHHEPRLSPAAKFTSRHSSCAASPLRHPGERETTQEIGAIAGTPGARSLRLIDKLQELVTARQRELLARLATPSLVPAFRPDCRK